MESAHSLWGGFDLSGCYVRKYREESALTEVLHRAVRPELELGSKQPPITDVSTYMRSFFTARVRFP